jgi:hypothetical protein
MEQRPRIYYTESQKTQMWERWQKGGPSIRSHSCLIEAALEISA